MCRLCGPEMGALPCLRVALQRLLPVELLALYVRSCRREQTLTMNCFAAMRMEIGRLLLSFGSNDAGV